MLKKVGALVMATIMLGTSLSAMAVPVSDEEKPADEVTVAGYPSSKGFDPETVMWTNNPIENVLAEQGVYANAAEVNPNADNKTKVLNSSKKEIQSAYGKPGETLTGWAYSEFIWTNSYPVGNGRMAGMVAGGIDKEVIQINEDTSWDGSPYGTLQDENGNKLTTLAQTSEAEKITTVDQTSGSKAEAWRYFRGANEDGSPAEIGASNVLVGDEAFRSAYPDFANKSIANQALNVNNAKTTSAVQQRYSMERMVEKTILGSPTKQRAYKSFVEVYLDFGQEHSKATDYTKSLDMETGVVTVEYDYEGSHFKRETIASYPDQVVATHVESNNDLNFSAELHTYHEDSSGNYYEYEKVSDKEVKVTASISNGSKDNSGVGTVNVINIEAHMFLDGDGAFSVADDNKTVNVKGGNSADIYVVGATNYVDYLNLDNTKPARDCEYYKANVVKRTYSEIKDRHIADFAPEFAKTSLTLTNDTKYANEFSELPTEQRVRQNIKGKSGFLTGGSSRTSDANKAGVYTTYSKGDNQLATLQFNYGKYLILAGARDARTATNADEINIPQSQPLNLTGKWSSGLSASWNGKYTININTEMNYWAAQPLNIGESEKTLIDTFDELAQGGAITAANQYAVYNERGDDTYQPGDPWVMHHNFDLWRGTQPIDNATAGLWPTGGVWLLDHAWQYYQYNNDLEYLAEVYPYMVGAAKFFVETLVIDPQTGYLVTAASCSPEQGGVQPGAAMDTQLVRNLYDMVQNASEILGKTAENATVLAKIAEQMPATYLSDEQGKVAPNLIDSAGLIKEWARGDVSFDLSITDEASKKYTVTNPFANNATIYIKEHGASNSTGHRHCSHLWELYPGTHLNPYTEDADEKKIFAAYQKSTSARGPGSGQGWGLAWRMSLNARALNGDYASDMFEQLLTTRTSPNLFDQHPNFQIDGNYGITAGVIEMLVQSHADSIDLLPAVPKKWQAGEFAGINTRRGAIVDLSWDGGIPREAKIHATKTGDISVRSKYAAQAKVYDSNNALVEATLSDNNNKITFAMVDGETYTITSFGSTVTEGDVAYLAGSASDFFASDGGTTPKLSNSDTNVGYIYRRDGVKVGYALNNVSFDNLKQLMLNMVKVRDDDTYVSITLDSVNGTEIANQIISTGDNIIELKNLDGVVGTHKVYLAFTQNPYNTTSTDKYLGDAGDLIGTYKSEVDPTEPTAPPRPLPTDQPIIGGTPTPLPTSEPKFTYEISDANIDADNNLSLTLNYDGEIGEDKGNLIVGAYNVDGALVDSAIFDVNGTTITDFGYTMPEDADKVRLYVWDGVDTMIPLSNVKEAFQSEKPTATPDPTKPPAPTEKPTASPAPIETTNPDTTYTVDLNQETNVDNRVFNSVRDAVLAANANPPASEADRIYINVAPGVYRAQVDVKAPYVTIQKQPGTEGEAKLTWYYGTSQLYDSADSNGKYDPSGIDGVVGKGAYGWGGTLIVDSKANNFIAKDLTLENSYNQYYTQEELTDILEVDPNTKNSFFKRVEWINAQIANGVSDDVINNWLQSRTEFTFGGVKSSPRERACALYASGDKSQFYNCRVTSKQDTIGINSGRMYFKDCFLAGTVDYICGSAEAVFSGCELNYFSGPNMEGSSKDLDAGTVTAPSNPVGTNGYLFFNCNITGTEYTSPGSLGRPWSGPSAGASYINTVIDNCTRSGYAGKPVVADSGWSEMTCKPEDACFTEYNSIDPNGKAVNTSSRTKGTLLNEWTMLRYNPLVFTSGKDAWDPEGLTETYAGVNGVINSTTIDTSDGSTNIISLPSAPSGYEFSWASDSEYATVSSDKTKMTVIRPANGEAPIKATVKLFVREAGNKTIGGEKSIAFNIEPTIDVENVFEVSGIVTLSSVSDADQAITIQFKNGEAVIKTTVVTVVAGSTSQTYTANNIPVGSYVAYPTTANAYYNVSPVSQNVTGIKGQTVTMDISAKKMQTITVSSGDFTSNGYTPSITSATGFSAGAYTATGDETANLGEAGGVFYKVTKDEGNTVAAKTGVSFDVKSMLPAGTSFANTKTIKFSYDFIMETIDYYPSDQSYFDLATSKTNAGADAIDQTKFARTAVMKNWGQLNFFGSTRTRINGDNTHFNANNNMQNKWYRIVYDIDLENNIVTATAYDRDWKTGDAGTYMLNNKPFTISAPDEDGANPNYPTGFDLSKLYFNIYMDKTANTSNKMEYFFDNLEVEYQDYE